MKGIKRWKVVSAVGGGFEKPEAPCSIIGDEIPGHRGEQPPIMLQVVSVDGRVITIDGGERYALLTPSKAYERWLGRQGLELDPKQPIKNTPAT